MHSLAETDVLPPALRKFQNNNDQIPELANWIHWQENVWGMTSQSQGQIPQRGDAVTPCS